MKIDEVDYLLVFKDDGSRILGFEGIAVPISLQYGINYGY